MNALGAGMKRGRVVVLGENGGPLNDLAAPFIDLEHLPDNLACKVMEPRLQESGRP